MRTNTTRSGIPALLLAALFASQAGCETIPFEGDPAAPPPPELADRADRDLAPLLMNLLEERKFQKPTTEDFEGTALGDVIKFTTPEGYLINTRLRELGVPVAQALSLSRDPQLRGRLLEAARWTGSPRVRAEALLGLATFHDPTHFKFFREAVLDSNPAVQFAAIEALEVWGQPEAAPLLLNISAQSWSPLIRCFAAQAALRLGSPLGRDRLIVFLRDTNWLMRAMAARYLGELGRPEDADLLIARIGPERDYKFVLAELCVGALNLTAKRGPAPPPPPPAAPARRRFRAVPAGPYELEPLVVVAPHLRLGLQVVDVRIDNELVQMLDRLASEPPPDQKVLPPELDDVNRLVSPQGFNIKTRYSDLVYLLTVGLAGVRDFGLVTKLENYARNNPNARVRAAALISLAADPARADLSIFSQGLRDPNVLTRWGAVEALGLIGDGRAIGALADAANSDASPAVRVFAAYHLRRSGDAYGREMLMRSLDDPDYVVRAMATYYLGEVGETNDYDRIAFRTGSEENVFVVAETCLTLLKLAR